MFPILVSIGSFHVYSFSIFLIISWVVWSFLFWRHLRNLAVQEDHIFDIMFYVSVVGLVVARIGFIITHTGLFADAWLKTVALWVQPGLSFYGAVVGAAFVIIVLALRFKLHIAYLMDAFALSFIGAYMMGLIGSFLDGSVFGKLASFPWAIRYVGHIGTRHPVQLYSFVMMTILALILWRIQLTAVKKKWPDGSVAMWFFGLFAPFAFIIEFFSESSVYWGSLSANQWILVLIFGQSLGAFYIRGGGKERLVLLGRGIQKILQRFIGGIYAKFSKRHS